MYSIRRPLSLSPLTGKTLKKPQEEQQRKDSSPRMDRHLIDLQCMQITDKFTVYKNSDDKIIVIHCVCASTVFIFVDVYPL